MSIKSAHCRRGEREARGHLCGERTDVISHSDRLFCCSIHFVASGKLVLIYRGEGMRRVEDVVFNPHLTSKYSHWSDTHIGTRICFFLFYMWFPLEMIQKKLPGQLRRQCHAYSNEVSLGPCHTKTVLFMTLQVERVRTILPSQILCPK